MALRDVRVYKKFSGDGSDSAAVGLVKHSADTARLAHGSSTECAHAFHTSIRRWILHHMAVAITIVMIRKTRFEIDDSFGLAKSAVC